MAVLRIAVTSTELLKLEGLGGVRLEGLAFEETLLFLVDEARQAAFASATILRFGDSRAIATANQEDIDVTAVHLLQRYLQRGLRTTAEVLHAVIPGFPQPQQSLLDSFPLGSKIQPGRANKNLKGE